MFKIPRDLAIVVEEAAFSMRLLLSSTQTQQQPQTRRLSQFERYRLARQISGSILELSNTSWIDSSVSTEQIILYGLEDEPVAGRDLVTPRPYLNVAVRDPQKTTSWRFIKGISDRPSQSH